jgi:hypothetical protein
MKAVLVRTTALLTVALAFSAAACSDVPTTASPSPVVGGPSSVAGGVFKLRDWLAGPAAAPGTEVLVGAGDIAECYQGNTPPPFNPTTDAKHSAAEQTAQLLDQIPGTVMPVGDNAYQFGTTLDYEACYHPTWGRHFDRTRPAAGNHEYMTPGAAGFFAYFRERVIPTPLPPGTDPRVLGNGYYSYNLGSSWHVVVLNSTTQVYACYPPEFTAVVRELPWILPHELSENPTSVTAGRLCAGDVAQQLWLVQDLKNHANYRCTAVYFHHPRFSSGHHGNHYQMQRIWDILYAYGVDVAITGHDHNYERFAPLNNEGKPDLAYGIRQFVVGTGGADLRSVGTAIPNSEVLLNDSHGVIALTLNDNGYGWAFIGVDRKIRDSGSQGCHDMPADPPVLPFTLPS